MFGFFKRKSESQTQEAAFDKISSLLTDDDLQIRVLGPKAYSTFSSYSAVDRKPNAEGEFGTTLTNPIPANGPIGSLAYLSRLSTDHGQRILFHRIQAIDGIDIYEYVSFSGKHWGVLFVDMHHSRKSNISPKGFVLMSPPQQLTGFNHSWDDFPYGFSDQKQKMPQELRLLYAPLSLVGKEMEGRDYTRPHMHDLTVSAIVSFSNQ